QEHRNEEERLLGIGPIRGAVARRRERDLDRVAPCVSRSSLQSCWNRELPGDVGNDARRDPVTRRSDAVVRQRRLELDEPQVETILLSLHPFAEHFQDVPPLVRERGVVSVPAVWSND